MTSSHLAAASCQWFAELARPLDRRSAPRLALLFLGALLARGRRTVTTWIRAAGLGDRFRSCYTAVAAAGKDADSIAARLALDVVKPLVQGAGRLTLALDDTPTPRYGPHVQGAGVHHNPTPGPAGSPHLYGHVFVVLAVLAPHPSWRTIALPLLARLYVRKKDLPGIDPGHRPPFRTKLELAVELLRWAKKWLGLLREPIWVVADGAYAKANFLKPAAAMGMTVVSRLRRDAALRTVPGPRPAGRRGRPADLRRGPDRPGEAGRPASRLDDRGPRHLRREGGQALQDVRGDLAAGRRRDPGGARGRADGLAGVLLHRHVGHGRRDPHDRGGSLLAGDRVPRLQGGRRGRSAAGAVRVGEHRGVPRLPLDVHDDRGLGLGPEGEVIGGPLGVALGP